MENGGLESFLWRMKCESGRCGNKDNKNINKKHNLNN